MEIKSLFIDNSGSPFVAFVNYSSRILFSALLFLMAPGWVGYVIAIAYLLVLHNVAWKIGDAFRNFTQPEVFLSSGAMDTFKTRLFWMMGPQLTSTFIFTVVVLFFFGLGHSINTNEEIAKTPPMPLEVDSKTGYYLFDVNKNSGFGTNAFYSAAMKKPVILTGGVVIHLTKNLDPQYQDTADKNLKKISFPTEKLDAYVPEDCVDKLAQTNEEIYAREVALPGRDCTTSGCIAIVEPTSIQAELFKNTSCKNLIVLNDAKIFPQCNISIDGKITSTGSSTDRTTNHCKILKTMIFSYTGALYRQLDLENLHKDKLQAQPD